MDRGILLPGKIPEMFPFRQYITSHVCYYIFVCMKNQRFFHNNLTLLGSGLCMLDFASCD